METVQKGGLGSQPTKTGLDGKIEQMRRGSLNGKWLGLIRGHGCGNSMDYLLVRMERVKEVVDTLDALRKELGASDALAVGVYKLQADAKRGRLAALEVLEVLHQLGGKQGYNELNGNAKSLAGTVVNAILESTYPSETMLAGNSRADLGIVAVNSNSQEPMTEGIMKGNEERPKESKTSDTKLGSGSGVVVGNSREDISWTWVPNGW